MYFQTTFFVFNRTDRRPTAEGILADNTMNTIVHDLFIESRFKEKNKTLM